MAIIGSMVSGAGILTSLNLPQCPEFLTINNTHSESFQLTALDVSINGNSVISLQGADSIDALAQIRSHSTGDVNAQTNGLIMGIALANGEINAPTLIRLTNEATGSDNIMGVSTNVGNAPYRYSQYTINSVSNQVFQQWDSLLLDNSPTNIDSIEIQYSNGFVNRFAPEELPLLFRGSYAAEITSKFSASGDISFIDNQDGLISGATIYTNSTGTCTVTVGRI